jgi:hypothetical protein
MQKSIRFGDLGPRIQRQADSEDRSFSYVVLRAVREWLDEFEEPSPEAKARVAEIVGDKTGVEALTALQKESNDLRAQRVVAAEKVSAAGAVLDRASGVTLFACPKANCIFTAVEPGVCPHHRNLTLKPREAS